MKWSWEGFSRHTQTICAVLLLAATIFLLVQTIILTTWTARSSGTSEQMASDINISTDQLLKIQTGVSNLAIGLTGVDSQLMKQLAEIKGDTTDTKDALGNIKDDISDIKKNVASIQAQVEDIKSLLTPPSQ